ncbi:hypothetical protein AHF37_04505 [Paragonimus kellicotti]|nr:hypothetical protein AHF37_04505 [Paragonimus kellicotti]
MHIVMFKIILFNSFSSLFPTMPRHNLIKAQPYVKELCKRHDIPYPVKPITVAFRDIVRALKKSAELWKKASRTTNKTD